MKRMLITVAALALLWTAAHASYTECIVKQDTETLNRPNGTHDPRWSNLSKGERVAIRDVFQDWAFVTFYTDRAEGYEYGWLPRSVLTSCKMREGTP